MSLRLQELLSEARNLENGPEKVRLLEEAVLEADEHADLEDGFTARMDLIEAAEFSGYAEKAIVAFSWCLSQVDKDNERFDEFDILWQYKWILGNVTHFPQISKRQILHMQDDLGVRLERMGCSPRPAYYMKFRNFLRMGMLDEANENARLWRTAARDVFADCAACELDNYIELLVRTRRHQQAVKQAAPIVDGRLECAEVPHMTLGSLLEPLMHLELEKQAAEIHRRGYHMIKDNAVFLSTVAQHLLYTCWSEQFDRALKLIEAHVAWALKSAELGKSYDFYRVAGATLEALHQRGTQQCRVRLPGEIPVAHTDGVYESQQLSQWFLGRADELAQRFDARNENPTFQQRIAATREFLSV